MKWWLRLALVLAVLGPIKAAAQTSTFPAAQDAICDPTPTEATNSTRCTNSALQAAQNDAIEALERKVGTGASTPQSGYILAGTGVGTSAYATQIPTATIVPTATPIPADTPRPTDTPAPTATPRATATQEALGFDFSTATPATGCIESAVSISQVDCVAPATAITPAPTATPRATDTPIPADTLVPTATPIPAVATATREAQSFAISTATLVANCLLQGVSSSQANCVANGTAVTPAPTATPRATDTPIPTPTAAGAGFTVTAVTVFLTGDVTMTNANTFYDGPTTATLVSGAKYAVSGHINLLAGGTSSNFTCKIWDGTTAYASGEQRPVGTTINSLVEVSFPAFAYSVANTNALKISCADGNTGSTIQATVTHNTTGLTNLASWITVMRVN